MKRLSILILGLLLAASPAQAGNSSFTDEVSHLLEFIEESDCTFIRNGKRYNPGEAGAHIRRKFDHIENRISTTEEFIRYGASKSSITGRSYQVECGSTSMPTAQWLEDELVRYREGRATDSHPSSPEASDGG